MFEPGADLATIPTIRQYKPRRGRWNRDAMKVLREANGPLAVAELAQRAAMLRDVSADDGPTRQSIICSPAGGAAAAGAARACGGERKAEALGDCSQVVKA